MRQRSEARATEAHSATRKGSGRGTAMQSDAVVYLVDRGRPRNSRRRARPGANGTPKKLKRPKNC